ncbi:hypothetical protein J6Y73_02975 [bacterium]|nr:hypothetical protein [bacterium]
MATIKKIIISIILFICFFACFENRIAKALDYSDYGYETLEEFLDALSASYLLDEREEPEENLSYVINNCETYIEKCNIEDLNFPISVGFQFKAVPRPFAEINSEEERLQHIKDMEELYKVQNEIYLSKINLSSYSGMYLSKYGPFIEFVYDSYANFLETDYQIVESFRDESLVCIYIDVSYASDTSNTTIEETPLDYDYDDAKSDVGIPENSEYTDEELEIEIKNVEVINSFTNLQIFEYEVIKETSETTLESEYSSIHSSFLDDDNDILESINIQEKSYNKVISNDEIKFNPSLIANDNKNDKYEEN